jgi:salicylate hydroxylase
VLLNHKVISLVSVRIPVWRHVFEPTKQDAEAGLVTVENGTAFSANVVIGADGIRSDMRSFFPDAITPQPYGESIYRMLLHAKDMPADHPILVDGKISKTIHLVKGPNRKIIAYPCRNGELMNLAAYVRKSMFFPVFSL